MSLSLEPPPYSYTPYGQQQQQQQQQHQSSPVEAGLSLSLAPSPPLPIFPTPTERHIQLPPAPAVGAGVGSPELKHSRPKVTEVWWEEMQTLVWQVEVEGGCIARRQDNNTVNGTKLLNLAHITRGKRDGILKNEKVRSVVKVGTIALKGVWIPFERGKTLAAQYEIDPVLGPLFDSDIARHVTLHQPSPHSAPAPLTSHPQSGAKPRPYTSEGPAHSPIAPPHASLSARPYTSEGLPSSFSEYSPATGGDDNIASRRGSYLPHIPLTSGLPGPAQGPERWEASPSPLHHHAGLKRRSMTALNQEAGYHGHSSPTGSIPPAHLRPPHPRRSTVSHPSSHHYYAGHPYSAPPPLPLPLQSARPVTEPQWSQHQSHSSAGPQRPGFFWRSSSIADALSSSSSPPMDSRRLSLASVASSSSRRSSLAPITPLSPASAPYHLGAAARSSTGLTDAFGFGAVHEEAGPDGGGPDAPFRPRGDTMCSTASSSASDWTAGSPVVPSTPNSAEWLSPSLSPFAGLALNSPAACSAQQQSPYFLNPAPLHQPPPPPSRSGHSTPNLEYTSLSANTGSASPEETPPAASWVATLKSYPEHYAPPPPALDSSLGFLTGESSSADDEYAPR